MNTGHLLKQTIVATSGLTIGLCVISIWATLRRYRPVSSIGWALVSAGVLTRVGLLLWLILPASTVPVTFPSIAYLAGLLMTCAGLGVLLRWRP